MCAEGDFPKINGINFSLFCYSKKISLWLTFLPLTLCAEGDSKSYSFTLWLLRPACLPPDSYRDRHPRKINNKYSKNFKLQLPNKTLLLNSTLGVSPIYRSLRTYPRNLNRIIPAKGKSKLI